MGGRGEGVNPILPRSNFHILPLSTSSRLNDSQVKCSLYKGGVTLQIAPIKFWGEGGSTMSSQICSQKKIGFSRGVA